MVATSHYADAELSTLRAPAGSAAALYDVLGDPSICGFEVTRAVDQPCDRLLKTIERFLKRCAREDLVLLYVSCHGLLDARGQLYFAAADTHKDDLLSTAMSSTWLRNCLGACDANRQVLILDCCFSGAYVRGVMGPREVPVIAKFATASRGRAVLTASRATEYSLEGEPVPGKVQPSVYTRHLIDGIRTGEADRDGDGVIAVADAHEYVERRLREEDVDQHPALLLYESGNKLELAHCRPRGALPPPSPWPVVAGRWRLLRRTWVRAALATAVIATLTALGLMLFALTRPDSGPGREGGDTTPSPLMVSGESVVFSPDGRVLAATHPGRADSLGLTNNDSIRLSNPRTGKAVRTLDSDDHDPVALAFSPDGRTLASAGWDGRVLLWDPANGRIIRTMSGHSQVNEVAFSPDGRLLASVGDNREVRLWDPRTGKLVSSIVAHAAGVSSVAFSPDGALLATSADTLLYEGDTSVRLWNPATGTRVRTLSGLEEGIQRLAFSPDGRTLAGASWDGSVHVWNTATGKQAEAIDADDHLPGAIAFSPDGRVLAGGGFDGTVSLWDPATGRALRTLTGHQGAVNSVAFSADGALLATGSDDRTVRVWNPDTGKLLRTL
ncbi:hypothetical protein H9Y04_14975 [Streptomyces sp. TRM66268-LWL]|uniref:Peptidase C14 caspase domain-containing protein n=1 Tax=Streptomyces polyasparticus TaxID=2767826 RepID=A0ABR7SEE1_9ACTN|nr:caspase family protein [Streptomyces polyasparticus]MBC9713872.1 hypothetical protein [Streptomyces polyasparticus]